MSLTCEFESRYLHKKGKELIFFPLFNINLNLVWLFGNKILAHEVRRSRLNDESSAF